jgi:hypothetical protein
MGRDDGSRRWGAAALAISVAVHALVGVMLRVRTERVPRPRPDSAVEITIETHAPPAATASPVPPASDLARRRRAPVTAVAQERVRQAPPTERPAAPAPSPDLLRMRRPGEDLSLDWGTFQALEGSQGGPPAARATGGRRARDPGTGSTAERVAEMLAPDAEENVRAGRVHPQFYDYLRDARARFHPTLATVEKDAGAPRVAGFFKAWWKSYLEELAARNGRPHPREATQEEQGAVELTCDICLTVRPGDTPEIEVVHHSISEDLDREAVTALRFSVSARPVDGPLLPAGLKRDAAGTARACYRFSASARRLSPAAIGCSFDEIKLEAGCVWPLKKIFRSEVKLISARPG